jgi:hypothetical protein
MHFSASDTEINVGEMVTWTVSASFTGLSPTGFFGGLWGNAAEEFGRFIASDDALGTASNLENFGGHPGATATVDGATIRNIYVIYEVPLGNHDSSIGVFYQFDVTASAMGQLSYTAAGVASLFASDFIFEPIINFTSWPVTSDVVNIVPAPSVLALLALGSLAGARRRR